MKNRPHAIRLKKLAQSYKHFFNIDEIESDPILQWSVGLFLFALFMNLKTWSGNTLTTIEAVTNHTAICWSTFQSCAKWIFFSLPPYGISQIVFFNVLFFLLASAAFFIYRKNWVAAHACMMVTYLARFYILAIAGTYAANYWLYITYFGFIFLCIPHKKFFARLMVVMCYFLSSASKISDSWVLGTYFSNLEGSLPLAPDGLEIIFTNIVLIMEMAGSWLLFSSNPRIQRSILVFFVVFHFYSVFLVGITFPSVILPWVVLLFGTAFMPYKNIPLDKKSYIGWVFMACLIFFQIIPYMIPKNDDYTQEGLSFSLHMINVNSQCHIKISDGERIVYKRSSVSPELSGACAFYANFFRLQSRLCPSANPLHLVFDHSINGQPFRRIVDAPDFCSLKYNAFTHNYWINDETNSPIVGYPHKTGPINDYSAKSMMMALYSKKDDAFDKNPWAAYNNLQRIFLPYLFYLYTFWWSLWWGLLAYLFSRFLLLSTIKKAARHAHG